MKAFLDQETIAALGALAPEQLRVLASMRAFCETMGIDLPAPAPMPSHPLLALTTVLVEITRANEAIIERIAAELEAVGEDLH